MGTGVDTTYGGLQLGKAASLGAKALAFTAQQHEKEAETTARKARAIEKLQERRLEANKIGRGLMEIDKEVEKLGALLATWEAEVKAQQEAIDHAQAEQDWMRTRYTNEEFYTLMESTVSTLFRQTFLMAVDMLKTVRRAMDFGLGLRNPLQNRIASFASTWETFQDGFLSGEGLAIELQKLQTTYETTKPWDYEIYHSISLRTIDPHAFLQLRDTGHASFELKESLFDRDFPGHYCRRLMETKVYLPGADRSVPCTLTLREHKYRTVAPKTGYAEQKSEHFRTDRISIQSITATKSGGGNGKLDTTFYYANEYFPFEGAGAVSKWDIELANELRQSDYARITDVELDINYAAIAGWDRGAALSAAADELAYGSTVASIDLINGLADEEEGLLKRQALPNVFEITDLPARLPHIISRGTATVSRVELLLKSRDDLGSIAATLNSDTELDTKDTFGSFVTRSLDDAGQVEITDQWELKLEQDSVAWEGKLDEAWLLVSVSVKDIL